MFITMAFAGSRRYRSSIFQTLVCAIFLMVLILQAGPATAQECSSEPVIAGYRDFSFAGGGVANPTEDETESKLWHHDGFWWSVFWDLHDQKYRIYRFDRDKQCWLNVGPDVDERPRSSADVLSDGEKLYIACHEKPNVDSAPESGRLYRFSYNAVSKRYSLDRSFPVNVNSGKSESLVLTKSSTGQLWITWTNNGKVMMNRTLGDDLSWGAPFALPVQGNDAAIQDVSSIISFGGNKIGVIWGNQIDQKYYFAVHLDNKADQDWEPREVALGDSTEIRMADNHINLKRNAQGDIVLAVVKTSLNVPQRPLYYVIKRNPNGSWSRHVFGLGRDFNNRVIMLVNSDNDSVYVVAPSDVNVDYKAIYMKKAHVNNLAFPEGLGTLFLKSASDQKVTNPTSTKQNLSGATGLLVIASDNVSKRYLHNYIDVSGRKSPVAVDDRAVTTLDTPIPINVTANDTDPDGDIDLSSVMIVLAAKNGTTSIHPSTGIITYTPNAGFRGADTLKYSVGDNNRARSNVANVFIRVNRPPVAVADSVTTPEDNRTDINVTGNDSDRDGRLDVTTVQVTLPPDNGSTSVNPTTGVITYTPNANFFGANNFRYTVKDNNGTISNEAIVNVRVTAVDDLPVAVADSATTQEDIPVNIEVTANDTDVDGRINVATVAIVAPPTHGRTLRNPTTGVVTYTPNQNFFGNDIFKYTAKSFNGATSNEATVRVTVTPIKDRPLALADSAITQEDKPVEIRVTANDTNPDGAINVTTVTVVAPPSNGTTSVNPTTGAITYMPKANFFGTDNFKYTVKNTIGDTSNVAIVKVAITAVNDLPMAVNDTVATKLNEDLDINITANDVDVDGSIDRTTVLIVEGVNHGTMSVNPTTGVVTYSPNNGFLGTDRFSYMVNDNANTTSNVATVLIRVNIPPVAVNDSYTAFEDRELTVPSPGVLSNDSDDRGAPLKAFLKSSPSHGSVTLNANGSIIYRPNANFNGLDSFTYVANDGISPGNVAQVTIRVNPVNDMPVAADDHYFIEGNAALNWPAPGVLNNDLDLEGDTLSAILLNRPLKGTLILNAKGSFSYTPNPNFTGVDSFTYKAKDGRLESATAAKVRITMLPAGRELWPARFAGPASSAEKAVAMAVDNLGNVFVTGWSFLLGRGFDFLTVKYSPNGNPLWVQRYNGPGNGKDVATAMALDQAGNLYVAGTSANKDTTLDYAVLKYDTHGNVLWEERYNGPGRGNDEVTALALDGGGNVYIAGVSWNAQTGMDYLTVKYNPNGNFQWEQLYTGPGNNEDRATAIAVDSRGNVFVTGESRGANTGFDYATLKYDSNGQLLWQRRHNGVANGDDRATALAVDIAGNIYVTGGSFGQSTGMDYVTLKYITNGNIAWTQRFNGSGNDYDRAVALAIDRENNVYVTGESKSADTGFDYVTLKYLSADGSPRWFRRYDGPTHGDDKAAALVLDGTGKVYVTGVSAGDYGTLKYDPQGNLLIKQLYNGPFNGVDAATAIGVDKAGNVYMTGGSEGMGTGEDIATVKLNSLQSAVEEPSATVAAPETYVLQQNHPNPFNPSTTIQFSLLRSGYVRLRVFDLAGNEVAVLVDGQKDQGQHQVIWEAGDLSTGAYFYRLEINGFTATRKLMLVK